MNADARGRANLEVFKVGDLVLLSTDTLKDNVISNLGSHKLLPKYIGPYKVIKCIGHAYTLNMPKSMRLHPTFYVGRLKRYHQFSSSALEATAPSTHLGVEGDLESGDNPPLRPPAFAANEQELASSVEFQTGCQLSSELQPSAHEADSEVEIEDTSLREAPSSTVEYYPVEKRSQLEEQSVEKPIEKKQRQLPSVSKPNDSKSLLERRKAIQDRILPPPAAPLIDNQGSTRWIVESLVDHRHRTFRSGTQNLEFLVHWLGYPSSSRTWEPRNILLQDIPDTVHEYEKTHGLV
jgi:hypothetical protein